MIKRIKQNKIWSLSPFSILIFERSEDTVEDIMDLLSNNDTLINRDSPEEQTRGEEDKKSKEDDKIEENDSLSAER